MSFPKEMDIYTYYGANEISFQKLQTTKAYPLQFLDECVRIRKEIGKETPVIMDIGGGNDTNTIDCFDDRIRIDPFHGSGKNLVRAVAESLPFRQCTADIIMMSETLFYLDTAKALSEFSRVLNNQGYILCFYHPCPGSLEHFHDDCMIPIGLDTQHLILEGFLQESGFQRTYTLMDGHHKMTVGKKL